MTTSRNQRAPSSLSPSDRIMWRIEQDPVLRTPVVVVALLDGEPDWQAVRSTLERAVATVPRLRQCVRSIRAGQQLVWADDERFSLDFHLRRVGAPHPGALRDVLDLAGPWATSALDTARPLWEFTLVDGVEGGRAAFVLKFHHTITDGVGGVDLAAKIFDADRHPRPVAATEGVAERPTPKIGGANRLTAAAREIARAAADPYGSLRKGARFARSLGRLLEPAPAPLSPMLVGRGLDRHLDLLELPLPDLRDAAHAVGLTINDLFLAAIGGGLHDFHRRAGHAVAALRITMPISLRRADDPEGGNRFVPARFILPIDDPDPVVRARIAHAIAQGWRSEPALATADALAAVLDRLPGALLTSLFAGMLKNVDVDVVDVPGLAGDAYVGGVHIDRMWAFAPPTGAALSITLLSHGDTACIGVLADRAAVSDVDLLTACLSSALDEVIAIRVPVEVHREVS